jgi:hypothetical protein
VLAIQHTVTKSWKPLFLLAGRWLCSVHLCDGVYELTRRALRSAVLPELHPVANAWRHGHLACTRCLDIPHYATPTTDRQRTGRTPAAGAWSSRVQHAGSGGQNAARYPPAQPHRHTMDPETHIGGTGPAEAVQMRGETQQPTCAGNAEAGRVHAAATPSAGGPYALVCTIGQAAQIVWYAEYTL